MPGVNSSIWIGMLAPAGTPREIVDTLSKAVNEALKSEDVMRQMQLQGMEPLGGSPRSSRSASRTTPRAGARF